MLMLMLMLMLHQHCDEGGETSWLQYECHNNRRFENMVLPATVTSPQREVLKRLLELLQVALHRDNHFIQDFKQIFELPQKEFKTKKLVIIAVQPRGEHTRHFNQKINL